MDSDEIPEEGYCFEALWPGARLADRCFKEAGHEGLHSNESGKLQWGAMMEHVENEAFPYRRVVDYHAPKGKDQET